MPPTLSASLSARLIANYGNIVGLSNANALIDRQYASSLATGTGTGQADRCFAETNTLATGANKDYDLAGVLTDVYGGTATFVKVKGVLVFADAANTTNLTLGNSAANQFVGFFGAATHTVQIKPGGCALFFCTDSTAWAVTAGTGDMLRVTNAAGASATYDIIIIGTSA